MPEQEQQPEPDFEWLTQEFLPKPEEEGEAKPYDIAQAMYDQGMIWLANRVLHPFGYALGVTVDDNKKVTGVNLHYSTDPQGVWFGEDLELRGRRKFYAALKGLASHLGW